MSGFTAETGTGGGEHWEEPVEVGKNMGHLPILDLPVSSSGARVGLPIQLNAAVV